MRKRLLVVGFVVVVAVAALVVFTNQSGVVTDADAAASPCLDLGRCAWAAEAYCDQIHGANASGARLVVTQKGHAGCEMCCDNGACATVDCG